MTDNEEAVVSRRALFAGAGVVGLSAVGLMAGCGQNGSASGGNQAQGGGAATQGGGEVKTSQVPVGGGIIVPGAVITQPTAGTFKAFSSTCTHMQCTVAQISNGKIECPCHGSQYNIADGSVATGPATRPLPSKNVTVSGDTITVS
jgi:Rieske Fe-S protein